MTWRELTLGDCVTLQSGGTPSKANAAYWSGPVPWVSAKDMTTLRLQDTEDHVSVEAIGNGTRLVQKGTLLAVVRGMSLAKEFRIVEVQRPMAFNQDVKAIIPRDGVDSRFILYSLLARREYVLGIADEAAHGTKRLQTDRFLAVPVSLPNLPMQRHIASILSAYDDLIENNTRRIAILEEMARRIYEEWFVRFRFPGHEQVRMVESDLGLIPEAWSWGCLRDVAEDVRESVHPEAVAPDTPYVGLEHIPRRSIALAEWGFASEVQSTKLSFVRGDILFGKIRPYFHKVAVAPVDGIASSDAIVIRARESKWYPLVLATVSSDAFVAEATQSANGTKMPRANWNVLLSYKLPKPTDEVLAKFNEIMLGVVDFVRVATLKNRNLRATRDLLLPKLISGELDVSTLSEPTV